jgi:hypothetical protein
MPDFATTVLSIAMVFGPIIGYVDQVREWNRETAMTGFSLYTTCFFPVSAHYTEKVECRLQFQDVRHSPICKV